MLNEELVKKTILMVAEELQTTAPYFTVWSSDEEYGTDGDIDETIKQIESLYFCDVTFWKNDCFAGSLYFRRGFTKQDGMIIPSSCLMLMDNTKTLDNYLMESGLIDEWNKTRLELTY